jgi:hypothetical protein
MPAPPEHVLLDGLLRPPRTGPFHAAQLYETEAFLCDVVADFLETGLESGEPLVVIATAARAARPQTQTGAVLPAICRRASDSRRLNLYARA